MVKFADTNILRISLEHSTNEISKLIFNKCIALLKPNKDITALLYSSLKFGTHSQTMKILGDSSYIHIFNEKINNKTIFEIAYEMNLIEVLKTIFDKHIKILTITPDEKNVEPVYVMSPPVLFLVTKFGTDNSLSQLIKNHPNFDYNSKDHKQMTSLDHCAAEESL